MEKKNGSTKARAALCTDFVAAMLFENENAALVLDRLVCL